MHTTCSIKSAALRAEVRTDENGDTHVETYWVLAFKVPADEIDANEINAMVGEQIQLDAMTVQTSLDLPSPKKVKAA